MGNMEEHHLPEILKEIKSMIVKIGKIKHAKRMLVTVHQKTSQVVSHYDVNDQRLLMSFPNIFYSPFITILASHLYL